MKNRIANYFLIKVKISDSITSYDITKSEKQIRSVPLEPGIYLCFIDEILLSKEKENQFCEIIYKNSIVIVRHRDIVNCII